MRVDKFKILSEKAKSEISDFDNLNEIMYCIYGKNTSQYALIQKCYSLDSCILWYKNNITKDKNENFTINHIIYREIIVTEEKKSSKILDIDIIISGKKFNL